MDHSLSCEGRWENIKITCTVSNNLDSGITLAPKFETRYRSSTGSVISDLVSVANAPVTLEPKVNKEVSFMLPKAKEPQIYNVLMSLNSDIISSNKISFNYSIKGVNATIQNITSDKQSYSKGDTAKISVLWLGSIENSTNSSLLFEMKMKDVYKNCIKPVSKVLNANESHFLTLEESVTTSCKNPQIKASIKDTTTGKILSEKEFVFNPSGAKEIKDYVYIGIVIGLLIIMGLSMYFIKLKNKKNEITNIQ